MVHQAHNIPWNLLASNLHWIPAGRCKCGARDLHPKCKPNQRKELIYFVKAFAKNIEDHSACERRKYPADYERPEDTSLVIDEVTVRKISPTVRRWRGYIKRVSPSSVDYGCSGTVCRIAKNEQCHCPPIPDEERQAAAFCRPFQYVPCYQFYKGNKMGFFNVELATTLILYGEMDPIFRACAHPNNALDTWWSQSVCSCGFDDAGWDQIYMIALRVYICLNVVHCFPQTWDPASGKTDETDYRHTKFYQYMLRTSTQTGHTSDVMTYPHRRFFGIQEKQFSAGPYLRIKNTAHWLRWSTLADKHGRIADRNAYGIVPFDEFLTLERDSDAESESDSASQQSLSEFYAVRWMLCRKGLPMELALDILELAKYKPGRRLEVPHDPFHPLNRDELNRYLTYCWLLLVRCDMLAKAVNITIPWEKSITECITRLWDSRYCSIIPKWYGYDLDTSAFVFL